MKAIALEELSDEDWKTQHAGKYSNIPAGAEVEIIKENFYNFYGGPWTRVEWKDNWYWVNPKSIKKVHNDE